MKIMNEKDKEWGGWKNEILLMVDLFQVDTSMVYTELNIGMSYTSFTTY